MVQVPPPVHGAALRNQSLVESPLLNEHFSIKLQALSFVKSIDEIGHVSVGKLFKAFLYAIRLIYNLITFRPHVAYFTLTPAGGAFYRDVVFVAIIKLFRVNVVYHLRGIGIKQASEKSTINHWIYRYVFSNAYVVCLSKKHVEDVSHLSFKRIFIVPNGIKLEADSKSARNASGKEFLFLSNYIKSKGVFEFIDAVEQVHKTKKDFTARMIGADADLTLGQIRNYVKEKHLEDVIKVGPGLYKKDKFEALLNCYCLVFPTYYSFELFPGVILEAMQCGKPVISTQHGVIEDIIDDQVTGMLVPVQDSISLAKKMIFLLDNPSAASAMGERAERKFHDHYTMAHFENNVKEMFEKI